MQGWNINPTTGDYALEDGAPVETNSLQLPAYYRLKIKRGKWLYAPDNDYGCDFYTVVKRPLDNANTLLENIGAAALQPLITDGRASRIEMTVDAQNRYGVGLQCKIVDASGQVETQTFKGLGL